MEFLKRLVTFVDLISDFIGMRYERITRADGKAYLDRFIVFRCPLFGIYIHKFRASDDDCLHDHPWTFLSLILWGSYTEFVGQGWKNNKWEEIKSTYYPTGSILFRKAKHAHKIILHNNYPLTLVLIGPRKRKWGFYGKKGWVYWLKYNYVHHCE